MVDPFRSSASFCKFRGLCRVVTESWHISRNPSPSAAFAVEFPIGFLKNSNVAVQSLQRLFPPRFSDSVHLLRTSNNPTTNGIDKAGTKFPLTRAGPAEIFSLAFVAARNFLITRPASRREATRRGATEMVATRGWDERRWDCQQGGGGKKYRIIKHSRNKAAYNNGAGYIF